MSPTVDKIQVYEPSSDSEAVLPSVTSTTKIKLYYRNPKLAIQPAKMNDGQYGARTHDIRVINTTLFPTELTGQLIDQNSSK